MESDRPSEPEELDERLRLMTEASGGFERLSTHARIEILKHVAQGIIAEAPAWVRAGDRAKGLPEGSGEEWLTGPLPVLRQLRLIAGTLERIRKRGTAIPPQRVTTQPDGRIDVAVYPAVAQDSFTVLPPIQIRQKISSGWTEEETIERAGRVYHTGTVDRSGVSLVLGAGNASCIPAMDAIHRGFAEGDVVILKLSPVNEWIGPHLERAFREMIEAGYLSIVYGGAEVAQYLIQHAAVDAVHLTGATETFDRIVWGPTPHERAKRKALKTPLLNRPITSALGDISPVVVVPDAYPRAELQSMATTVVSSMTGLATFGCSATSLLVLSSKWSQRDLFLKLVAEMLEGISPRLAYYPNAVDRYELLTGGRSQVQRIGNRTPTKLPWTILHELDSQNTEEPMFSMEPFCSLLGVTSIPERDPGLFLTQAVKFLNERVVGGLTATLLVSKRLEVSREGGKALEGSIDELRYGTVSLNCWAGMAHIVGSPAWGGHPSASLDNIQSGLGWMHNTFLLDGIEKTVMRTSFGPYPQPVWSSMNAHKGEIGRLWFELEARPSWWKLPNLVWSYLRS